MSLPVQFEQPWLLSLLVLVPAMLYAVRHSLTTIGEILVVIDAFQEEEQSIVASMLKEASMEVTVVKPEGLPEKLTVLPADDLVVARQRRLAQR